VSDRTILYAAAFLRAVAVGAAGVFTAIYLTGRGLSVGAIGVVIGAGMAGGAVTTLAVGLRADLRFGRRATLATLSALGSLGYLALLVPAGPALIAVLAFAGAMNAMGRDRGGIAALEQAILPDTVGDERRTWAMAWYNVWLDAGHAAGALAGATPALMMSVGGWDAAAAYRFSLVGCATLLGAGAVLQALASDRIEADRVETDPRPGPAGSGGSGPAPGARGLTTVTPQTHRAVRRLAVLFGLDSLGGGFLSSSLVALWFFSRYGLDERQIALLFFAARMLNALSHLGAAWLATRIGLVNTMVFTHLPSSLFLMAAPAAPTAAGASALFLAREGLVEMDVPTRQSYVMAIVRREERSYASGVTNLTRTLGWAAGPAVAGFVMQHLALAAPLVIGASLKIVYDLLLYSSFRHLKAPEEQRG
jgi:MFS family permease